MTEKHGRLARSTRDEVARLREATREDGDRYENTLDHLSARADNLETAADATAHAQTGMEAATSHLVVSIANLNTTMGAKMKEQEAKIKELGEKLDDKKRRDEGRDAELKRQNGRIDILDGRIMVSQ